LTAKRQTKSWGGEAIGEGPFCHLLWLPYVRGGEVRVSSKMVTKEKRNRCMKGKCGELGDRTFLIKEKIHQGEMTSRKTTWPRVTKKLNKAICKRLLKKSLQPTRTGGTLRAYRGKSRKRQQLMGGKGRLPSNRDKGWPA